MNKFAVVFAAAGLMALAACGEKPAAETNNASNEVVVNETENAANALDNAANAVSNATNATNTANAM
jgi:predicted small lipoprotein YifL